MKLVQVKTIRTVEVDNRCVRDLNAKHDTSHILM
jgi:hypothetical protein